ncbi:MAG TPA: zf-TFIIB domain-containing protein, partial [Candidatus Udaeobacter sp.]|nr:zf-TFIIB domain-containing protein [Candidatus Udaeobacter sp.]
VRDRRQLTLICPECFAACAGNARYCGHCGVEFRPQPVQGASDLACPACQTALVTRSIAEVAVQSCPQCAGLWVPGESFDLLVARAQSLPDAPRPSQGLSVTRRHAPEPADQAPGGIVYRRCPACQSPMHRKNFGQASGVIVDWCGPHGTWLDADELERIAEFIKNGGFERAMAARAADEAQQRAQVAAAEAGAPRPPAHPEPTLALFEHLLKAERKATTPRSGGLLVDLLHDFFKP